MQFTIIIVFLIPVVLARHHHRTLLEAILKSKGNLFSKVDDDVQNVMNILFDSLNLEAYFITKSRIKLLLTMHYDLKSMAEKNYDVYEKMQDAAKPEFGNKTANKIELFELIEEILDDKYLNMTGKKNKKKDLRKHTKHKTELSISESSSEAEFADSKEFKQFIEDFIKKVDNLTENDFTKKTPTLIVTDEPEEDVSEGSFNIWKPPKVIELDYVNDTNSRRIFRGRITKIKKYPFMASVHLMGTFTCAGSIIHQDLVISAASCLQLLYNNRFYRENPRSLYVRVGSDYFARGGERIEIIETYFHPSYNPKTLANNLVILRLQKHLSFSRKQKRVKRIEYDTTEEHLSLNTEGVLVIGWGSRKQSQIIDQFGRLLVAQLDMYHIHECADIYSKVYVTNKNFCAGFISSGGGACNKDLGGPGIVSGKLVGVISFGAPVCGSVDSPTVFTKLGHYSQWIDDIRSMRPSILAVRTTLQMLYTTHVIHNPKDYDRKIKITPVTVPVVDTTGFRVKSDDILALQTILKEIAKSNNSVLRDILYGDTDEDFHDMFKPTEKIDPIQHPLANKTLFLMPEIHTFGTETTEYVTVDLTTSSTALPNPITDPIIESTTPPPTRQIVTASDYDITDLLRATSPVPPSEAPTININEDDNQLVNYGSYEDTPTVTPTTTSTPTVATGKQSLRHRHRHHHRHNRHKKAFTESIIGDYYNSEIAANIPRDYYDSGNVMI